MRINFHKINDIILLELDGPLAGSSSNCLADTVCRAVSTNSTKFVIDMEHVPFVDSCGLGALIAALKAVLQYSGQIRISSLNPAVYSIFELTRLHRLFDICTDKRQAVLSFDLPLDDRWRRPLMPVSPVCKTSV